MKHRTLAALFAAALAAHGYSADDAKSRTDAFLRNEMETGRLDRMSVAYEQHGETRYTFMAGPGSDQPMHVASITKTVTAVLVMQLAEEGKLCLNDYVKKYVPLFPAEDVTILHLMTHTSGWRNKTGHSKQPGRAEEFYGTMFKEFEPGEKFRYMSQGYDILAEIVEKLTGVDDVADVAKSRVFEPLGMDGTNLAPHQGQAGMNTTAADLVKFGRELLDIQKKRRVGILLPESVDALFHPVLKPEFNRTPGFFRKSGATGFGQYFCELNSFDAMSHSGATGCNFLIDPGRDAVEDAMSLRFPGADGAMVPLSSVGEFRHMLGPRAIMRRDKRPYAGIVIRPGEGASTLEMVRRIEENPPDERKYVVAYSTMTQEEVASRGKFGRMAAAGLMLMYLVLVAATESWLAPIRHLTDALPAVAGGVFGIWVAEQEFTILAQLALMFVFAFSAGISLRPLRAVPAAFAAALGVAILASVLLPGVGASTFRAFAVPFASGMAVLLLAQAALHKTFNNKTEEEST